MLFISKHLQYPSCACVRNILKFVTFVTGKVKLVSFSLFLDAFPPRPKIIFGQRHVAINIYNICKGRLGSRGWEGVVEAKEDIKPLTKIDCFATWSFLLYINCIKYILYRDRPFVYLSETVCFTYMLLKKQAQLMIIINSHSKRSMIIICIKDINDYNIRTRLQGCLYGWSMCIC